MKKVIIKWKEIDGVGGQNLEFTLPDGKKLCATEIGYDMIATGDYAEPSQYRYKSKYYDEFGFEIYKLDGQDIVIYKPGGFVEIDEDALKMAKKVLLYWCKSDIDSWEGSYEMPSRYLELVTKESK
tara:strand:- start:462 stop:839 length:378 start_codon:yes stop_codon:yes gene_type:complete